MPNQCAHSHAVVSDGTVLERDQQLLPQTFGSRVVRNDQPAIAVPRATVSQCSLIQTQRHKRDALRTMCWPWGTDPSSCADRRRCTSTPCPKSEACDVSETQRLLPSMIRSGQRTYRVHGPVLRLEPEDGRQRGARPECEQLGAHRLVERVDDLPEALDDTVRRRRPARV
jgi:hypothetical protein